MDAREAKRAVCADVASMMIEMIADGEVRLDLPGDDRARYVDGFCDLADELLRRSGVRPVQTAPVVDERQMTVYDFVGTSSD